MNVFIIRHAIAEVAAPGQLDADRALTDRGRKRFQSVVETLARLEVSFDRIYTSPWKRAAQTAELLSRLSKEVVVTDLLAMTPDEPLLDRLHRENGAESSIACIGHEPWMAELASLLLLGDRSAADKVPFKKGGVTWLSGESIAGGMELRGLLPPRWARTLV
ncbi:MAG: phosphohistidine phosphatase SixA [Myxococcota bacterium]